MKVCIIALDALEYELVQTFYCENLKQKQYGKIDLTEFKQQSPTGEPFTPVIWSSFITGKMPTQTGITIERVHSNPVLEAVRKLLIGFGLADEIVNTLSIQRKDWIKEKILRPIGLRARGRAKFIGVKEAWKTEEEYYRKMKLGTIFDFSKNPIVVAMPAFKRYSNVRARETAESLIKGRITREEFAQQEIDFFDKEINEAFILSQKNWDLFVFYTKIIDYVGHFLAWDKRTMWHLYERADKFVEEFTKKVGRNTFILVISDHGMKRTGMHSDHAFYSTNSLLSLEKPKITDFYRIITEKLVT
jgi:hypothetical protein